LRHGHIAKQQVRFKLQLGLQHMATPVLSYCCRLTATVYAGTLCFTRFPCRCDPQQQQGPKAEQADLASFCLSPFAPCASEYHIRFPLRCIHQWKRGVQSKDG
jgi:hypothetical protein